MRQSHARLVHGAMMLCALTVSSAFGLMGSATAQLAPQSMIAPRVEPSVPSRLQRALQPTLAAMRSSGWTTSAAAAQHRSPLAAGFLGVLPGVGHLYAGEGRRGLAVATVWLGSGLVMFSDADRSIVAIAAVLNIGTYVFSIADAALAAERFNTRQRQ